MNRLRVFPANGEPFDWTVEGEKVVVGRSRKSHLVLADGHVSREHSEIYLEGDRMVIRDLGSRNGTIVNGVRIEGPTPLANGDEIRISSSRIEVGTGVERPVARPPVTDSLEGTVFLSASDLAEKFVAEAGPLAEKDDLQRQSERLRILNEVHQALAGSIEIEELLELILDRAFDHLGPQQGAVFLRDPAGGWKRVASRRTGGDDQTLYSSTLVNEVAEKGMAALVLDARSDQRFGEAESILSSGVQSLIAAPLLYPEGSLGMIALSSSLSTRLFEEVDLELLSSLASIAALRIWSLSLTEEAAERRQMATELELARRIQTALLSEEIPQLGGYDLETVNVPSRGVSGDFYTIVARADGRECVAFLADVSGKGMGASILTATLEALAAVPISEGMPPDEICTMLSRLLEQRTPSEKFATAFLAVLDNESGLLTYANAGHNPALVARAGGEIDKLERTGIPLGLLPGAKYESRQIKLEPGDLLVAYTDGITEAANPQEDEYGLERLAAICQRYRKEPLPQLLEALDADLERFMAGEVFADDRTLIALRRHES